MKLKEFYIDGFRNVVDTRLKLGNIVCLVSPNNLGKSNVLDGFLFGLNFMRRVNERFSYSPANQAMPLLKSNFGKDFAFEMLLEDDSREITYGYSFSWDKKLSIPSSINKEYLKVKEAGARRAKTYIDRVEAERFRYLSSKDASKMNFGLLNKQTLAVNLLFGQSNVFFNKIIEELFKPSAFIDRIGDPIFFPVLELSRQPLPGQPPLTELYKAIADFISASPEKKSNLVEAIQSFFPDIEDIVAETGVMVFNGSNAHFERRTPNPGEGEIAVAQVKSRNLTTMVGLDMMSNGFRRILAFLLHVFEAQDREGVVLAIEEPENAINPSLLSSFVDYISSINENASLILSSHSPFIVNGLKPSSVYVGVPNEDGTARFRSFKKAKENALNNDADDFDVDVGTYIFDLLGRNDENQSKLDSYLDK